MSILKDIMRDSFTAGDNSRQFIEAPSPVFQLKILLISLQNDKLKYVSLSSFKIA